MRSRLETNVLAVSVVTVGELKRGAILARWGERKIRELNAHIATYIALTVDSEVAEEWARVRVRSDEVGRPKTDNDLWIAATAKRYGLPMATLDRHQLNIPGLRVIGEDGIEVNVPE